MMDTRNDLTCGEGVLHPVCIASLVVLLFNDHYWKGTGPPLITGKLSDVMVLILGPLVLQAAVEWASLLTRGRWAPSRSVLVSSAVIMAAIMILINLWNPAAWAYRWGLATAQWPALAAWALVNQTGIPPLRPVHLTMDPADLWTVPVAAVPVMMGWKRAAPSKREQAARPT